MLEKKKKGVHVTICSRITRRPALCVGRQSWGQVARGSSGGKQQRSKTTHGLGFCTVWFKSQLTHVESSPEPHLFLHMEKEPAANMKGPPLRVTLPPLLILN